jgi:hypothetical protein
MSSDDSERLRRARASASEIREGARPGSGPPSSGRTPAEFVAWGPVRDAMTSIHNLETLLKSPRVANKVLAGVLPDFMASVTLLRGSFAPLADATLPPRGSAPKIRSDEASAARAALSAFTLTRLDELDAAMRAATSGDLDARLRLGLEQVVARVSVDLDAAAELLDLADRAENAVPMELSLDGLARVSLRSAPRGESEVFVRLERAVPDCLMSADAQVLTRLLGFATARVHAFGAEHITIRAGYEATSAHIRVEPSESGDSDLGPLPMRLVRRIDPTDAIVTSAARAAGIAIETDGRSVTFTIPRAG